VCWSQAGEGLGGRCGDCVVIGPEMRSMRARMGSRPGRHASERGAGTGEPGVLASERAKGWNPCQRFRYCCFSCRELKMRIITLPSLWAVAVWLASVF
jgi:hypothetical protein